MRPAALVTLLTLLVSLSHAQEENAQQKEIAAATDIAEFARLQRLASALPTIEFPDSKHRIRFWIQHNTAGSVQKLDPGVGITMDADEATLGRIKGLLEINWKGYDLENVVVMTKGGRRIEFVDMTDEKNEEVAARVVRRGDAVLFLKQPKAP